MTRLPKNVFSSHYRRTGFLARRVANLRLRSGLIACSLGERYSVAVYRSGSAPGMVCRCWSAGIDVLALLRAPNGMVHDRRYSSIVLRWLLWRASSVNPRVVVRGREVDLWRWTLFGVAVVILLVLSTMFTAFSARPGVVVPSFVVAGDVLLVVAMVLLAVVCRYAVGCRTQ